MFKPKMLLGLFVTLAIIIGFAWGFWANNLSKNQIKKKLENSEVSQNKTENESEIKKIIEPTEPDLLASRVLFMGTTFWGRYIHDWSMANDLKFAYPFSGLDSLERNEYQAWVAGLECPITPADVSSQDQEAILAFNCRPEYLPEAKKYFTAFNLANNHTDNMQTFNGLDYDGFSQTKKILNDNQIQYFGHYDNSNLDDICKVIILDARNVYNQTPEKIKDNTYKIPIAMCGFHNVFRLPRTEEIETINQYSKYFITIAFNHQGAEYQMVADDLQRQISKQMIDIGADVILNDHVHVVQDSEIYKDKLIVYSMGNFMFDQQPENFGRLGKRISHSLAMDLDFRVSPEQLNQDFIKNCQQNQKTCLETAKNLDIKKPQFKIYYQAKATDNSGKLTKKADKANADIIFRQSKILPLLEKLNNQ